MRKHKRKPLKKFMVVSLKLEDLRHATRHAKDPIERAAAAFAYRELRGLYRTTPVTKW